MKKAFKITAFVVLLLVLLLAALLAGANTIVNSTAVKSYLEQRISDAARLTVRIDGRIRLSALPSPTLLARGVRVSFNAQRDFGSAAELRVGIHLLELMSGNVHIDLLEISRPRVTLDDQNWADLIAFADHFKGKTPVVQSLVVGAFSISEGSVALNAVQIAFDVSELSLSGSKLALVENRRSLLRDWIGLLKTANLQAAMSLKRLQTRNLQFEDMHVRLRANAGMLTADPLEFVVLGARTTITAETNLNQAEPLITMRVDLAAPEIEPLVRRMFKGIRLNGKLSLHAGLTAAGIQLDLAPAALSRNRPSKTQAGAGHDTAPLPLDSLSLDSVSVTDASLRYADKTSSIEISKLTLEGGELALIEDGRLTRTDPVALLKRADLNGKAFIPRLLTSEVELKNIMADFALTKGRLRVEPLSFRYSDSSGQVAAVLNLAEKKPDLKLRISMSDLNIAPLAERFLAKTGIKGKLTFQSDLSMAGIDLDRLLRASPPKKPDSAEKKAESPLPVQSLEVQNFSISKGALNFSDGTRELDASEITFAAKNVVIIEKSRLKELDPIGLLKEADFTGQAAIKRISSPNLQLEQIKAKIAGQKGRIDVQPVKLRYYGEQVNFSGQIDLQASVPQLRLQVDMPELDLERFLKQTQAESKIFGILKLKGKFTTEGTNSDDLIRQLQGEISIQGSNLLLKGFNLDKVLEELQGMEGYGFLDLAALLTTGPLATVVTQGFGKLDALYRIGEAQGDSRISQIVSDWKIADGTATATDVAFSTPRQRVAVVGAINILKERYHNLIIAVVDDKGCVVTSETINGPLNKPEIKETGILDRTIFRPLKKLLSAGCQSFYNGAVVHPATAPPR